jgi:hypothetical protein
VTESWSTDRKKGRTQRLVGLFAIILGVAVSWVILAKFMLGVEHDDWIRLPLYFLAIVFYWNVAWAATATYIDDFATLRERWVRGAGCLFIALVVFLVVCLLLTILFLG